MPDTNVADLIDLAINDNAVDLKAGLDDVLRDKILHKISVVKPDVIQGMFGQHGVVNSSDSNEQDTTEVLDPADVESDEQKQVDDEAGEGSEEESTEE